MTQSHKLTDEYRVDSWAYDKHFLITGASSGIGLHLSKHYMGTCRKLTLVSRNTNGGLDEAVRELRDIGKRLQREGNYIDTRIDCRCIDVRDKASIGSLVGEIYESQNDQVDAFINCAGAAIGSPSWSA